MNAMNVVRRRPWRMLVACALTCAACTGGDSDAESCGEGTEARFGMCVAVVNPSTTCGEGTDLDERTGECTPRVQCGPDTELNTETGACEPLAECGPGTYRDLATRTCLPDATCGPGTRFDALTETCVPDAVCGPGTVQHENGSCVPTEQCGPGTSRSTTSGLCESNVTCGPGQSLVDGVCVRPADAFGLEADAVEGVDHNDPLYGGTPEPLALEAMGQRTVFLGTIGRPADLAGTGAPVQDRDVWRFNGRAGQLLRIRVLSSGLPQPAFVLSGPSGYERRSAVGYTLEADRHLMLTRDGPYDLLVVPTAWLQDGRLLGSIDAGYVGIIEEVALPGQVGVAPGVSLAEPTAFNGNLRDHTGNLLYVSSGARTALQAMFATVSAETKPALVFMTSGRQLLTDVQVDGAQGWAGCYAAAAGTLLFVDWVSSTGPGDAFTLNIARAPVVQSGALVAGTSLVTSSQTITGMESAAFVFSVGQPHVVTVDITRSVAPDVIVQGPGGTRAHLNDEDELFFFADTGEYAVLVFNDGTTDDTGVTLTLGAVAAPDLGSLGPGEEATASGPMLGHSLNRWEDAWARVRAAQDGLIAIDLDVEAGDPDFFAYSLGGELVRARERMDLGRTIHVQVRAGEPVLLRLVADDRAIIDWTLTARAMLQPTIAAVEPDDTFAAATPLGTLPAVAWGTIQDGTVDMFRYTLEEALQPGQSIEIRFDNLLGDTVSGTTSDAVLVGVFDDLGSPVLSIPPNTAGKPGSLGPTTVTYIGAHEGAGTFHVQLLGEFITGDAPYVLQVRVVDIPVEVEPNDDADTADVLSALPATIAAYRSSADVADFFRFQLPDVVGNDRSLLIAAENLENSNALTLELLNDAGDVLSSDNHVYAAIQRNNINAGGYLVRVTGAAGGEPLYRLHVGFGPPMEVEPNNTPFEATDLGELGTAALEIDGIADSGDDVFIFRLSTPLAAGESIVARALNLSDTTAMSLWLFDGTPSLLSQDSQVIATTTSSAFGGTGPFGFVVRGGAARDRYRVLLERGPVAEREPNDTQGQATTLPLSTSMRGTVGGGEEDHFLINLPSPLGATEALRVELRNLSDSTTMEVTLLTEAAAELVTASGRTATARTADGQAGTRFYARVETRQSASTASDLYEVRAEVVDVP